MEFNRNPLIAATCIAFLGAASALHAGEIVRSAGGAVETINCQGQSVSIKGASSSFTLVGECPLVSVTGTSNKVQIELAGAVTVAGASNEVVWSRGINGERPRISDTGTGNTIRQGTVPERGSMARPGAQVSSEAAAVTINEDGITNVIKCDGGEVCINGDGNTLRLRGECGVVNVSGDRNTLMIEAARSISVMGDANKILWERGVAGNAPKISDLGESNRIRRVAE
jgi:hypothetical protein